MQIPQVLKILNRRSLQRSKKHTRENGVLIPHTYFSNGCFIASTASSYFGMTTLRHYTNARSACLPNVRDRIEAAWQEWELSCESSNLSL